MGPSRFVGPTSASSSSSLSMFVCLLVSFHLVVLSSVRNTLGTLTWRHRIGHLHIYRRWMALSRKESGKVEWRARIVISLLRADLGERQQLLARLQERLSDAIEEVDE